MTVAVIDSPHTFLEVTCLWEKTSSLMTGESAGVRDVGGSAYAMNYAHRGLWRCTAVTEIPENECIGNLKKASKTYIIKSMLNPCPIVTAEGEVCFFCVCADLKSGNSERFHYPVELPTRLATSHQATGQHTHCSGSCFKESKCCLHTFTATACVHTQTQTHTWVRTDRLLQIPPF